jgi:hypothetical protein
MSHDHEPTFEEINNLAPMVRPGAEIEPVAFIDKSGSNQWPAVKGGAGMRWDLVGELMGGVVTKLAAVDSQAAQEESGGGLMTVTFADPNGGSNPAQVLGDLNPRNFPQLWGQIRIGGRTYAVPGWELLEQNYFEEFGDRPVTERPLLGVLGVGDGIMDDLDGFVGKLGSLSATVRMAFAIHGYDNERAIEAFKEVEQTHPKAFRLIQVTPGTPADTVGDAMVNLLGLAA